MDSPLPVFADISSVVATLMKMLLVPAYCFSIAFVECGSGFIYDTALKNKSYSCISCLYRPSDCFVIKLIKCIRHIVFSIIRKDYVHFTTAFKNALQIHC